MLDTTPTSAGGFSGAERGTTSIMGTILWLIAVIFVIAGIVTIVRGGLLYGIVLIVVGLLIGPGGVSVFT
ncbi:GPGG-motif small membrane protein [Frankia sp. R82]|nr:GPGG-motif small membrane protein [Frankia sp. R82]MCM3885398.1 GPGG-motif small membrane protein [Frankia sp. R82]